MTKEFASLKYVVSNDVHVNFRATVIKVFPPIRVKNKKTGREIELQNVEITDDSLVPDKLVLVLWGPYVNQYKEEEQIEVTDAYTKEWDEKPQIHLAKTAAIKKLASVPKEQAEPQSEPEIEPDPELSLTESEIARDNERNSVQLPELSEDEVK